MPLAAARLVPSPPSTTAQPTPISSILVAALVVSSGVAVSGISRIWHSARSFSSLERSEITVQPIWNVSGINHTESIPMAWAASTMRLTMLTFS